MTSTSVSSKGVRLGLLAVAALAMVTAILAGLARMGWAVQSPAPSVSHGPLLVLGFLGTVVSMERAVALRLRWTWFVPSVSAAAVLVTLTGMPSLLAAALLAAAGLGLVIIFITAYRIQAELHIVVMGIGAVSWVVAAAGMVAESPMYAIVSALAGFLVLTIVGERLELTRIIGVTTGSRVLLLSAVLLIIAGAILALFQPESGVRLTGAGLLVAAFWLAFNDVARRTVRTPGVTRYMAVALLAGYVWLMAAGVIWVTSGLVPGTPSYDAGVHAVFLGYVFSMVFAHAPIIVPVLSGVALPYRTWLWVPLVALHVSLAVRVIGDLAGWGRVSMWGGMLNVAAIAIFIVSTVTSMLLSRREATGA